MPHSPIIIYDRDGNPIGEYYPPHDDEPSPEGAISEQPKAKMVLDLDKIAELRGIKTKKDKDG